MSVVLIILAYPPSTAWLRWLIFIALVPLIRFLDHAETKKRAFWGLFLFSFLFLGWNIRWFFSVLPADWAGIENPVAGAALVGIIWLLTTIVLSLPMAAVGTLYATIQTKRAQQHITKPLLFLLPSLWILGEYLRAWLFSVFWVGPGTLLGPHWTFGFLGYDLTNFPLLLQSSKLVGVYGAGFLLILANVCAARIIATRGLHIHRRLTFTRFHLVRFSNIAIVCAIVTALLFYGARQLKSDRSPPGEIKKIVLLQTNAYHYAFHDAAAFEQFIRDELNLLRRAAYQKPDIVILPEGSRLTLRFGERTPAILQDIFGTERSIIIVDSARLSQTGPSKERTFIYDTRAGLIGISDKTLTIPGGEYLPTVLTTAARFAGQKKWLDRFAHLRHIIPGEYSPHAALDPRRQPLGIQLCSAVLAPHLWRDPVKNASAQLLVNAASQGLFKGSAFRDQALAWLRFFAASNDRWLAQAANSGYSYIIDNNGQVRARTDTLGLQTIAGIVEYRATKTPYVRFGDWPLIAAIIVLVLTIVSGRPITIKINREIKPNSGGHPHTPPENAGRFEAASDEPC
ncbi:MAG: hypothetical protein AAB539_02705 [Patescibacteria group bacterium]